MQTASQPVTRDEIFKVAQALPAAPQALAALCELLQDVNTDLDQLADAIRIDAALAARIIRISNSAVFGGGLRIGSVDEAVNRVGFSEILRLVGVATVANVVDRALLSYNVTAEQMRESLLLHALASEALAPIAGVDQRMAYTGGLLRGLGMIVLDRVRRQRQPTSEAYEEARFASYAEWERATFQITNSEVATMILDEWRFAAELVAGLQEHLAPRGTAEEDRLAWVLNLAGAIVAEAGRSLPGERGSWTLTPEKLMAAGIDEEQWRDVAAQACERFEQQRAALE